MADDLAGDEQMIKRIDTHGVGLTDWEMDFVDSCLKRLQSGKALTEKQRAVAIRIDEQRVR